MDWLLERQSQIEKKLAARHLSEGGLALYDLTSSDFEGVTCPLAELGSVVRIAVDTEAILFELRQDSHVDSKHRSLANLGQDQLIMSCIAGAGS